MTAIKKQSFAEKGGFRPGAVISVVRQIALPAPASQPVQMLEKPFFALPQNEQPLLLFPEHILR
jgi:hypothetical protein